MRLSSNEECCLSMRSRGDATSTKGASVNTTSTGGNTVPKKEPKPSCFRTDVIWDSITAWAQGLCASMLRRAPSERICASVARVSDPDAARRYSSACAERRLSGEGSEIPQQLSWGGPITGCPRQCSGQLMPPFIRHVGNLPSSQTELVGRDGQLQGGVHSRAVAQGDDDEGYD